MQAALQLLEFLQLPSPRREGPVADRPRCKARGFSIRVRRGAGLRGSSGLRVRGSPPPPSNLFTEGRSPPPPPPASPLFTEGRSYPLACEVEDTAPQDHELTQLVLSPRLRSRRHRPAQRLRWPDAARHHKKRASTVNVRTQEAIQARHHKKCAHAKKLYKRDITKNAHTPSSYASETSQKMRTRQEARTNPPLRARARTHTHTHTHTQAIELEPSNASSYNRCAAYSRDC